jgi:hypothetical protein
MGGFQHGRGGGGPEKMVARAGEKRRIGRLLHPIGSPTARESAMEPVRAGLGLGLIATVILEFIKMLSLITR